MGRNGKEMLQARSFGVCEEEKDGGTAWLNLRHIYPVLHNER